MPIDVRRGSSSPIRFRARFTIVLSRKTMPDATMAARSVQRWARVMWPAVSHRHGYAPTHAGTGSDRARRVRRVPAHDGRDRRGPAGGERPVEAARRDPPDGVL